MRALTFPISGLSARICELPLPPEVREQYAAWLPSRWQNAVDKRKDQSLGARWCAVGAAEELGVQLTEIPNDAVGMPLWPAGVVGSLAHTDFLAVAVLSRDHGCLGVDVEEMFDEKKVELLCDTILTQNEKHALGSDPHERSFQLTAIFGLKEAAYKALYPELRVFIDFHQLEVNLLELKIVHESGRALKGLLSQERGHVISVVYG